MEDSVNVLKFAEARKREIASLVEDVDFRKHKTAFQRLPPHMRRRAASHNPKRVPRKLREAYLIQNPHATAKPKKAPKKMRKKQQKKRHEKQLKNYPEEYASRSRPGEEWLETHIWHAKRCKMTNIWGYKIPFCCNDKKLGATHQAATKHAMLQDLSYYCCIELKGPADQLFESLSCLTDPNTGSHFASEMFLDGSREGHTFLYRPKRFPYEAIGPVTFIWKPLQTESDELKPYTKGNVVRQLWIWCHPSFHNELVSVFVELFQFQKLATKTEPVNSETEEAESEKKKMVFSSKVNFAKTKKHFQEENRYDNGSVQMDLLKGKLVRHRLIGPNAQSVIMNVLALANTESSNQVKNTFDSTQHSSEDCPEENSAKNSKKPKLSVDVPFKNHYDNSEIFKVSTENNFSTTGKRKRDENIELNGIINSQFSTNTDSPAKRIKSESSIELEEVSQFKFNLWWKSYYKSELNKASLVKRKALIECLRNTRSGYYIPPNSVIGFTVRDPRLILIRDKLKFSSLKDCSDIGKYMEDLLTIEMSDSPLWDEDIRNEVTASQIPESEINEERAKYVVPSDSFNMGDKESRVPVLLIKQAGINGFGCGWDLIAPLGWGMAFWIPLILNGGRATGLKDLHFVNLETGQASFPLSYPDTNAGAIYEENQRIERLTTYFKKPPAKRPNFNTFGTPNPFFMPWDVLVKDWEKELRCNQNSFLFPTISCNIESISCEEKDDQRRFFSLRQKEVRKLENLCERLCKMPKGNGPNATKEWENLKQVYNDFVLTSLSSQKHFSKSLVLVRLKCLTRGCPTEYSGVYALGDTDLEEVKRNPSFLGPVEPKHAKLKDNVHSVKENIDVDCKKKNIDESSNKGFSIAKNLDSIKDGTKDNLSGSVENLDSKEENEEHSSKESAQNLDSKQECKELSSKESVQNIDSKEINKEHSSKESKQNLDSKEGNKEHFSDESVQNLDSKEENKEHSSKETKKHCNNQIDPKKLERPHIETLVSSSSRELIGFISEGGFSSIHGKGCGIGHCSFLGLLRVIKNCINTRLKPFVLIREQHSFQYRTTLIEIMPTYL